MSVFSFLGIKSTQPNNSKTAYDFVFERIDGGELSLKDFTGKVLLIVNTASECGFAKQFETLEELYKQYKEKGLVVIGIPSNDFGGQEPANDEQIKVYCDSHFGITFPLASKSKITGADAHPFYTWAGEVLGFGTKPKWNFHKYLVNKRGQLVDYFHSTTNPDSKNIKFAVERLL